MNRSLCCLWLRRLLRLHYDVQVIGIDILQKNSTYLILPNHTAYIDPLILFGELYWLPLRPMSDESFMRHWLYGRLLRIVNAIEVPDLQNSRMTRKEGAEKAALLSNIAIQNLQNKQDICFYPSGHIKTIDKEVIGNRRLAYEVCRNLPDGVRVILCRMRGLETSHWSKLTPKQWLWRRQVTLHFEDHTDDVQLWAQTLQRHAFNQQLEMWYND